MSQCSICLEKINKIETPLVCGHLFHYNCLQQVENKKCPICRRYIRKSIRITRQNSKMDIYKLIWINTQIRLFMLSELNVLEIRHFLHWCYDHSVRLKEYTLLNKILQNICLDIIGIGKPSHILQSNWLDLKTICAGYLCANPVSL
jgi:hypothetical protein